MAHDDFPNGSDCRGEWIDVSVPLHSDTVVWPGDPPIQVEQIASMEKGDEINLTRIGMSAHTGTHMDAPRHFLRNGAGIDQMPLSATVGPARVIAIEDPVAAGAAELARHGIRRGERILLKTRNSLSPIYQAPFAQDYVHVAPDGARYLAQCGIRCLGVDYLSVGGFSTGNDQTHVALLEAGIWVIEGLDLSRVEPGTVDLICLPLKLVGADGAPARAAVRSGQGSPATDPYAGG